jgi:epsilon-lactone hydrolase
MVNFELIKIDSEFEKILKEDQELKEVAAREFAKSEGIPVENAIEMKGDWNLILGLNRFTTEYIGDFQKNYIPEIVISKKFKIKEVNAEWTIVPNSREERAFLYFFGGGYIMGSLSASSYIRYLLGRYTGVNVLGIDYSLAPEMPFPAALDDAISSYEWLLSNGYNAQNIIIGGSSAGGGLAMAMLLKAKELGLKFPKAAVLISPWVDLTCRAKSIKKSREIEPELATGLKPMASLYAKGENKKNPYISPVFGDLNKLPPLLIHAGSVEGLLDDAQLLAKNAKFQNVEVELKIWDNMPHDFQTYGDNHPTGKLAFEDISDFVQRHFNL